ncbi:cupin domain-containing protein [Bacillus nitroreducens]
MYYVPYVYPSHYHQHYQPYMNVPMYHWNYSNYFQSPMSREKVVFKDQGRQPFVVNINEASKQNQNYRTSIWTGDHLQVTLMSLQVGEDIGLEVHPNVDQFLRLEQGHGLVQMGKRKENLDFVREVNDDSAIIIPAGTWHNLTNIGNVPLKLYSIYAPPNHPFGTVHKTKMEAMAAESEHHE